MHVINWNKYTQRYKLYDETKSDVDAMLCLGACLSILSFLKVNAQFGNNP